MNNSDFEVWPLAAWYISAFRRNPEGVDNRFPRNFCKCYQTTRRHILQDSTVGTVSPDYMKTLQQEERLELWKQLDFYFIFWYLQISYTGGTWGRWEDVRETRGLSRMEQFVIRDDYDDDTDDDGDDDDTELTTVEATVLSNRKYSCRLKRVCCTIHRLKILVISTKN
jgi:hypothetical protein